MSSGQSFVERFAKKSNPTFTSTPLGPKAGESSASASVPTPAAPDNSNAFSSKTTTTRKPVSPEKKSKAELIYLVKGIDAGRNAWYYVLVERLKVQLFLKALNDEIIHLEKYGQILYSAYGDEPPASVTDQLKEEYGIE